MSKIKKKKKNKDHPKIIVVTESPDDCPRTWPAIEHIATPLRDHFPKLKRMSVLPSDPKNGKAATKTELKHAVPLLESLSKADYVVLVGNAPLQVVTGKAGITKVRGKPFEIEGTHYLPMNNPSIIKHDPNQEAVLEGDMRLLIDMVKFGGVPKEENLNMRMVITGDDVVEMLEDLRGCVSFDIETNGLYPWAKDAIITAMGFGTRNHQWVIFPENSQFSPWSREEMEDIVERITEVLDDCLITTQNGKFDMLWMRVHYGVQWEMEFDSMLAHFLLDENARHGLKYLAQVFMGAPDWDVDLDTKKGAGNAKKQAIYLAHDVYYTRGLRKILLRMLRDDPEVHDVFTHILMPSANLFVEIEFNGVFIDVDKFGDAEVFLREQYEESLADLKQWEPSGLTNAKGKPVDFNWGSTKMLAELLYDKLKLPVIEHTPAGGRSCSESVIKRLNHPCTESLLKFRKAKQQLSFFIDGWKPYLHERPDGFYLHPSFKLHGTVTGRLSCENPNLQQVPRDKRIRTLVSAPDGWTLIECDLSQVELRVAAELAQERSMMHAFTHGIDIHWATAIGEIKRGGALPELVKDTARTWKQDKKLTYSQSLEVLIEMGPDAAVEINPEWKEFRKKAKAVNFGYLYGMWWKKFKDYARDSYGVDLSDEDAEGSRVAFFDNYSDLPDWHKRQRIYANRHGFVKSLSGRKRRLPDAQISDPKDGRRKAAERQAINSPVQSFANDINLMAAIQLRKEYGLNKVKICGTVHDAVLFRVKNEYVEEVYQRMLVIMQRPELMDTLDIDISVPIEADGEIGPWGAGVDLDKWKKEMAA